MRYRIFVGAWILVGGSLLMQASAQISAALAERIRAAEQRLAGAPDEAVFMFDLGGLRARAGDRAGALSLLEQVVSGKTGVDPEGSAFDRFKDDPAYQALLARVRHDFPPVVGSTVAFTIPQPDLIPEGIAYDPAGKRFFVGSIFKQKVVAITRDGVVIDFVTSARDGLTVPLGLSVDPTRRLLWAAAEFRVANPDGTSVLRTGLAAYDLATGRLARQALIDAAGHRPNDLVVTKNGDVYVTDSRSNEVYRLAAGGTRLERILDSTQIQQPNGIALAPDESRVFIAAWPSIVAMDLRTRKVMSLRRGGHVVTAGIDGLYFHNGSLIGVQNELHPGRVVRFELSADLGAVERVRVIEAYNPRFEAPTTGVIAEGCFYVIANTQLGKIDPTTGKLLVPVGELKPVVILRNVLAW